MVAMAQQIGQEITTEAGGGLDRVPFRVVQLLGQRVHRHDRGDMRGEGGLEGDDVLGQSRLGHRGEATIVVVAVEALIGSGAIAHPMFDDGGDAVRAKAVNPCTGSSPGFDQPELARASQNFMLA